jgi:sporulation protein YlmC with PRC-barrel domain
LVAIANILVTIGHLQMKNVFFAACGLLGACAVAQAQVLKAANQEGVVRLISELIEERKASNVQLHDFVLDLETGHAALQVVSWLHTDGAKRVVAVAPFSPNIDVKRATQLSKELSSAEPTTLTRELAATLHSTFGQDIYWSKYISRLQPAAGKKFDKEKHELVPFATLKDKRIVDIDGGALGTLVDVGLRESGDIVYCVLQSSDGALRAIPLGAFLDRERCKDWKIELKRDQILQFSPYNRREIPQNIDRGWQEYVAVRYGRDTLQEVPKADPSSQSLKSKPK